MKILAIIIIFIFQLTSLFAQKIKNVKIYAVPFDNSYIVDFSKEDIKRKFDLLLIIENEKVLLKIDSAFKSELLIPEIEFKKRTDFRAIIKLHYGLFNVKKIYISSTGHIIIGNCTYKPINNFTKLVYSYLPKSYYYIEH